jgi:hypothetical protein
MPTPLPEQDPRHAGAVDGRAAMERKVQYVAERVRQALAIVG